jgi:hypothetical protein
MSIIKTERSFAYTPTHRYVILTTLFAFRTQQLFFLLYHQCVREKKKKRKIFVLLKEAACTHLIYVYIYIFIYIYIWKKKNACAWLRSDNDNVTILRKEKKEPCTYGH